MTNLSLTYSFWWIFLCVVVGVTYAWIQYNKEAPWPRKTNYMLALLRATLITLLCFIFLEPYFNSISNYIEKQKVIIAVDTSESIAINSSDEVIVELKGKIKKIKKLFNNNNFDVSVVNIEGIKIDKIDSIKFDASSTDLANQLLAIKAANANSNTSSIVLLSDGIFNAGYTPLAVNTGFPIYTIGLGDTTEVKDLAILEVLHNSTVFEGNELVMEVQLLNNGFLEANTTISISQDGKEIEKRNVFFKPSKKLVKSNFVIPIKGSGKQSLTIHLNPVKGEFTALNNVKTIYFDVIDAQKKVLLVAGAPHPDIKAMRSSIEKSDYYKVDLVYKLPAKLDYDLVIAHQYPTAQTAMADKERFINSTIPKWLIIGAATDFNFILSRVDMLKMEGGGGGMDLVKPVLNSKFNAFQLGDGFREWVSNLPPLTVPYGISSELVQLEVLLNQQVGNVITQKPLLFFTKNKEIRLGILLGTNNWKWRLDEFKTSNLHTHYNELISKTVQYLSANEGKKRFYVKPIKDQFEIGEDVLFTTEEYNSLFERITGKEVTLIIKKELGAQVTYVYTPLSNNSSYKLRGMSEGVYTYFASSVIENKNHTYSGQFIIKKLNKEAINPVSDFSLLRKMAAKNNGIFYKVDEIEAFYKEIETLQPVSIIHSSETEKSVLNLIWVFGLLIVIATGEWFLRKFSGGY